MYYDVVVAGGSIAGLLCAREIACKHSVLVLEEDSEIGTPEHCGGLVSSAGLADLGVIPVGMTLNHRIKSARIFAPDKTSITIPSERQNVLEVNRRELDKQIANQAQKNGADIKIMTSFQKTTPDGVRAGNSDIRCKIFVDARGTQSLAQKDSSGMLQSGQYEVYADWIKKAEVQVHLDQEKFPGFFAWVIPTGNRRGKVGVAARGINPARTLEKFLEEKDHTVIRKLYAPIWVGGPVRQFLDGKTVTVGDAAGQAKPTTAGGIYSSGMGGLLAGRAVSRFLLTGNHSDLEQYQKKWQKRFGSEFERQLLARKILEGLDNDTVNRLFRSVSPGTLREISDKDDFDFHAVTIARLLGAKLTAKAAKELVGYKLKKALK